MVAFEILVNGKPLYVIGVGDLGILCADVHWHRLPTKGPLSERAYICGRAMNASDKLHSKWPDEELKVGDEITIRVVDVDNCDVPASRDSLDEIKKQAGTFPERPT